MTDELKDLYNTPSYPWMAPFDAKAIKKPASWTAYNELGEEGESGGNTDALRHLLGAATLYKRQPSLAETLLNWHENPNVFTWMGGGYGQRPADREMDLHNNALGIEIAKKAKNYDEALQMAKQYVKEGKVKLAPPEPPPTQPAVIPNHDRNFTFHEWLDTYKNSK